MSKRSPELAGLEDVDWLNLQHAYGAAGDVPDQLLALSEGDDSVLWELFGNIYHQGTLYQATAYAVPFLWRLLASGGEAPNPGIAALLNAIAESSSFERSKWTENARVEVWKGDSIAIALLSSSRETARRCSVGILACFPESADRIVPRFQTLLCRSDCSAHERARVGLGLAALGNYDSNAFGESSVPFISQAKRLAQTAAHGDKEAIRTCVWILTETIDWDPEDLANWNCDEGE